MAAAPYRRQSYDRLRGIARLAVFVIIWFHDPGLLGGVGSIRFERGFLLRGRLVIVIGLRYRVLVLLCRVGVRRLNVRLFKAHVAH
jgi:hypothetical protein